MKTAGQQHRPSEPQKSRPALLAPSGIVARVIPFLPATPQQRFSPCSVTRLELHFSERQEICTLQARHLSPENPTFAEFRRRQSSAAPHLARSVGNDQVMVGLAFPAAALGCSPTEGRASGQR